MKYQAALYSAQRQAACLLKNNPVLSNTVFTSSTCQKAGYIFLHRNKQLAFLEGIWNNINKNIVSGMEKIGLSVGRSSHRFDLLFAL